MGRPLRGEMLLAGLSGLKGIFPMGQEITVEIGGTPVRVRNESPAFLEMLEERYSGFLNPEALPAFEFEVELVAPRKIPDENDLSVRFESGRWLIERGDLRAEWDSAARRCHIMQSANPYAIDTALRIIHSLILARQGGLLMHAASAVRNGKAFVFTGVSGAGKTTISRLAPADATVLTDEISYLTRNGHGYIAHGTPFAGELARVGENVRAPLAALYLLQKGPANKIETISGGAAVRSLMENVLFFARDPELVTLVFESACELVHRVPVYRLTFLPDQRVWELIS
jgi:hypothetical protein